MVRDILGFVSAMGSICGVIVVLPALWRGSKALWLSTVAWPFPILVWTYAFVILAPAAISIVLLWPHIRCYFPRVQFKGLVNEIKMCEKKALGLQIELRKMQTTKHSSFQDFRSDMIRLSVKLEALKIPTVEDIQSQPESLEHCWTYLASLGALADVGDIKAARKISETSDLIESTCDKGETNG